MKKNDQVSLICTILNEEASIEPLLESIKTQTKPPDEVVFTDAGSVDRTLKLIENFLGRSNMEIKIIRHHGNRSQGRNLAISKAKFDIIAVTDAGVVLDKNWLERITKPLIDKSADAVAGYYLPITPTVFQKAVAPFVSVMPDRFKPQSYLPSSRSVAFTKAAWLKAGKYPEDVAYCEDLKFASNLKRKTRLNVVKNALVYWVQTSSYQEFFHQIESYAHGDIEVLHRPHLLKIFTIYLRYVFFIIIPPLFPLYLAWSAKKHVHYVRHPLSLIYTPALQIVSDVAILTGSLNGLISRLRSTAIVKPTAFGPQTA